MFDIYDQNDRHASWENTGGSSPLRAPWFPNHSEVRVAALFDGSVSPDAKTVEVSDRTPGDRMGAIDYTSTEDGVTDYALT